jgi:uncharacterized protein (TIRG00374 family)
MSSRSRYLGFAVTLIFIALLAWKIDLREVQSALASANYLWAVPAIGTTVISYLLRTRRWQRILRPIRLLPFRTLLPVLFIGFMANNLLPARIGELVRAYTLGRKTGVSKSLGLATILLERLCDGLSLVFVLGLVAVLFPLPSWGREAGIIAGALFVALTLLSLGALLRQDLALQILDRLIRPLPAAAAGRVRTQVEAFIAGLRVLRHGSDLLVIAAWSAVIWSVELCTYLLVLRSVHPTLPSGTTILAAMLLLAMVNLGTLIPSAPGYVGAFQFFGVLALSAFGVPAPMGLAVAIVAHVVQWLTVTGIGLLFVARESLGLGNLARAGRPVPAAVLATGENSSAE